MVFVRFLSEDGMVEGETVHELSQAPYQSTRMGAGTHRLTDLKLLAPVQPHKIFALAWNNRDHLGDKKPPAEPQILLGSTRGNDVSARGWQKQDLNWRRAQSSDTFTPSARGSSRSLTPPM